MAYNYNIYIIYIIYILYKIYVDIKAKHVDVIEGSFPNAAVVSGGSLGKDGRQCDKGGRRIQSVCGPCQHGKVNASGCLIACV